MPQDNDWDILDSDDDESGEQSPDLDLEHIRVFSIADEDEAEIDDLEDDDMLERPALETVLAHLEGGSRIYADLAGLSDLSTSDLRVLAVHWPVIAADLRVSVVREAFDIGQDDFRLQFGRIFLFATADEEPEVRQVAAMALGFEADPVAADRLLEMLRSDPSDDVRAEAANSLGPYVELAEMESLSQDLGDRLKEELFRIAEDDAESWHIRRRAIESVSSSGPNERINDLVQLLYDEEELGLRASALYAAGKANLRAWLSAAIDELGNDDSEIRFEAARALGFFEDVEALPALSELAKADEDVDVRHAAIAAIGDIGGAGAIRILSRLVELAPESDIEPIDDALIEASLESDPFSFGVDAG